MLKWFIIAAVVLACAIWARRRVVVRRRTTRRRLRRDRNIRYQKLWNQIMVRPRSKRLTFTKESGD